MVHARRVACAGLFFGTSRLAEGRVWLASSGADSQSCAFSSDPNDFAVWDQGATGDLDKPQPSFSRQFVDARAADPDAMSAFVDGPSQPLRRKVTFLLRPFCATPRRLFAATLNPLSALALRPFVLLALWGISGLGVRIHSRPSSVR
jgi:hypothetical protein